MTRWMMTLIGAMSIAPLALVDPAAALLLFDLEFLTMMGAAGVALLRGNAHLVRQSILANPSVVMMRSGWSMTCDHPGSLLEV